MPRFKTPDYGLKLIPVDFAQQVLPGSFEFALGICFLFTLAANSGGELFVQLLNVVGLAHRFCSKTTMMLSSPGGVSTTPLWCYHRLNEQKREKKQGQIWRE